MQDESVFGCELIHNGDFDKFIADHGGYCQFSRDRMIKFLEFCYNSLVSNIYVSENGASINYCENVEKTLFLLKKAHKEIMEMKTNEPLKLVQQLVLAFSA